MGSCSNTGYRGYTSVDCEKQINDNINKQLKIAKKLYPYNSESSKILVWGIECSGVSTIFKQIKTMYNDKVNDVDDRGDYIAYIHKQCVDQMSLMIKLLHKKQNKYPYILSKQALEAKRYFVNHSKCKRWIIDKYIREIEENIENIIPLEIYELIHLYTFSSKLLNEWHIKQRLSDNLVESIKCLWNEEGIKQIYKKKENIYTYESSSYFWNEIDRINKINYIPSPKDILLVHPKGLNMMEHRFTVNNDKFFIFNMGERRHRLESFLYDFADSILFVASLDCYDLFINDKIPYPYYRNAMQTQLWLFDKVVNDRRFDNSEKILWLNKVDIFKEKIKTIPINIECGIFGSYEGDIKSFDECIEYIQNRFIEIYHPWKKQLKQLYFHITCAVHQDTIQQNIQHLLHVTKYHPL